MTLDAYERQYPPRSDLPRGAEVTRIAPSPTGFPHIGTALQATINRALATKTSGVFILRVEDTDQARQVLGATAAIIEGLRWLDLLPDEGPQIGGAYGPYFQSERLPLYAAAAAWLMEHEHAYHCFCTPERLDEMRRAQVKAGASPMYNGQCRHLAADEVRERLARGESAAIRMRTPGHGEIEFFDEIRGTIRIHAREVDDAVLLKSDGFPTYHLAVVVDDHFMRVTTTVRGEEWISSTPKHVLLYRYFRWVMPRIVHTPLLRDAERRKLSKRSGDTSLAYFASQGILPEAFRNFLTRLVWVHPEDKDVYDFGEFVAGVTPASLPKTGPVADFALLGFINAQHLRRLSPGQLYAVVLHTLDQFVSAGNGFQDTFEGAESRVSLSQQDLVRLRDAFVAHRDLATAAVGLEPERFKRVTDAILESRLYFPELFTAPSPEALRKAVGNSALAERFLAVYRARHDAVTRSPEMWEGFVRDQAAELGAKPGQLFMLLRLAITGSSQSPPTYNVIRIIGPTESRRRIDLALRALSAATAEGSAQSVE